MEIELGKLLRAIRRNWWLPIVTAVFVGLVGAGIGAITPRTYTADTRILIIPGDVSGPSILDGNPDMLIDLATSAPILRQVIEELGLELTDVQLRNDVVAIQQTGTSMILISVTNEDPQLAADISIKISEALEVRANEITLVELQNRQAELEFQSQSLGDQLESINARIDILVETGDPDDSQVQAEIAGLREESLDIAQSRADVDASLRSIREQISLTYSAVTIVQPAEVPLEPDGLSWLILAILGAFVGVMIGVALVLLAAVRDKTVTNGRQVAAITGAPMLRHISSEALKRDFHFIRRLTSGLRNSQNEVSAPLALAAPTRLEAIEAMWSGGESGDNMVLANGVVNNEDALSAALTASGVVIAVQVGKTTELDLQTTIEMLRVANVHIIGNIVVSER